MTKYIKHIRILKEGESTVFLCEKDERSKLQKTLLQCARKERTGAKYRTWQVSRQGVYGVAIERIKDE